VAALTAINAVKGLRLDPETGEPWLKNRFGSVSGRAIKPIGLRVVAELRDAGINIPIIATGGIRTFDDCREYFWAGADAVSLGSAVWLARMPRYALGPLEGLRIRRLIDRISRFEPPPRVARAWAEHCEVPRATKAAEAIDVESERAPLDEGIPVGAHS
jgi:dihydroorotate dehydrogenase (NAD+) catalytic subunit